MAREVTSSQRAGLHIATHPSAVFTDTQFGKAAQGWMGQWALYRHLHAPSTGHSAPYTTSHSSLTFAGRGHECHFTEDATEALGVSGNCLRPPSKRWQSALLTQALGLQGLCSLGVSAATFSSFERKTLGWASGQGGEDLCQKQCSQRCR